MTNVVIAPFVKQDPTIKEFYNRLQDALTGCPDEMPIATIVGTIEMFKANLLVVYQTIEDED